MSDRLREALDRWDDLSPVEPSDGDVDVFAAAARRFLALTETGPTHEWCKTHTSNGRGPSPFGEACHYAALQMVVHPEWAIEPCSWIPAHVIPADYLTEEADEQ